MGGFAEDALLHHEITRDRADLDLLVERENWPELQDQLGAVGLGKFEPLLCGPAGKPLGFVSRERVIPVEVWLAIPQADRYTLLLPGDRSRFFRLTLPADTFTFPRTTLNGVSLQTVSPLALCLLRATSAQTRGDAKKRSNDLEMMGSLIRDLVRQL